MSARKASSLELTEKEDTTHERTKKPWTISMLFKPSSKMRTASERAWRSSSGVRWPESESYVEATKAIQVVRKGEVRRRKSTV